MLRSTTIVALALGFAAPAVADTARVTSSYEGEKFEYVSRLGEADAVRIEGKFLKSGEPFTFTVKPSGRVDGFVGQTPVSFKISRKQHDAIARPLKVVEPQLAAATAAASAGAN